jgi:hypothetical protein
LQTEKVFFVSFSSENEDLAASPFHFHPTIPRRDLWILQCTRRALRR